MPRHGDDAGAERLRELFAVASELAAAEREAFVRAAAGDDGALASEVLRLCAAVDAADTRAVAAGVHGLLARAESELSEAPLPERIGPYRILSEMGRGGMGIVYRAARADLENQVALKVSRQPLGLSAQEVLLRFERERRTLAAMSHRCIAKVFDAGTTDQGQPYFVMELVDGVPLTQFCRDRDLSVPARLQLFQEVCAGVQHAHGKAIVHRDLKPDNVLVVDEGGTAVPKILDFGLAKVLDPDEAGHELGLTGDDRRLGTLLYMAPEQVLGKSQEVDVRSDVYSLGVMLYELLSGVLPFSAQRLEQVQQRDGYPAALAMLAEREPERPSRRIAGSGSSRALRGDLDRIVAKAMAKEQDRRYQAATALAEDIGRHLEHLPVLAAPDSASYRLRKFVRRYRGWLAAASLLSLTLIGGATGTLFGFAEARAENRRFRLTRHTVEQTEARASMRSLSPDPDTLQRGWHDLRDDLAAWIRRWEPAWLAAAAEVDGELSRLLADVEVQSPLDVDGAVEAIEHRVEMLRRELGSWQRAVDLANGSRVLQELPLDDAIAGLPLVELHRFASQRVSSVADQPRIFGEEGLALTAIKRVLEGLREEDAKSGVFGKLFASNNKKAAALDAFAWAQAWNGQLAEARETVREALAALNGNPEYERTVRNLDTLCDQLQSGRPRRIAELLVALDVEATRDLARLVPAIGDPMQRFLCETMLTFRRGWNELRDPVAGDLAVARRRLAWAEAVREQTLMPRAGHPSWQEARDAILLADGKVASDRYAAVPIDLAQQEGMVPIGMNPVTKLWEFYHLRSAWNAHAGDVPADFAIPVHDSESGRIEVTPVMGIVFVLIPGGTYAIGTADPRDNEPLQTVELRPFFLARYELTQGQWLRLSRDGKNPSLLTADDWNIGMRVAANDAHPVEQVSWTMADTLLRSHGLLLPTEAQWEVAARAGTTTTWSTGGDVDSLRGSANIHDATAKQFGPFQGESVPWSDRFMLHAPVGTFLPNAWGLHDMHGNIAEWCRDWFAAWDEVPAREGDGLRLVADDGRPNQNKIVRGGSFREQLIETKSGFRTVSAPAAQYGQYGLRAARVLAQ